MAAHDVYRNLWKITRSAVVYEHMENDNRANQILGFKIDFDKFILTYTIKEEITVERSIYRPASGHFISL